MTRRVIIDTDGGVDDVLALLLALRSSELRVEAITTVHGVVPVDQATRNVLFLLDLLGLAERPILARGAATPLGKKPVTGQSVHGADGIGEIARFTSPDGIRRYRERPLPVGMPDAREVLGDILKAHPGEITIITLGPLTNMARLLATDSALGHIQRIIVMGGAVTVPGNVTPAAEFNMFADPDAAAAFFKAGLPVTLVPLDVTERVFLTRPEVEQLSSHMDISLGTFLRDATEKICAYMEETVGTGGLFLHDPLAVGVAIDPSLVMTASLHVEVETKGEVTEGMTVADTRQIRTALKQRPCADVALDVDAPRFLNLFRERLCLA